MVGSVISQLELHLQICPQQLVVRTPLSARLSTFGKPAALILPTGSWGHFLAKQPTTEGGRYSFLYAGGNVLISIKFELHEESLYFFYSKIPSWYLVSSPIFYFVAIANA